MSQQTTPSESPNAPAPPGLRITGAHLEFHGAALFDGLELELEAGRWTCLLGPSGVGKSSLLRMLAGLVAPGAAAEIAATDGLPLAGRIAYMAQQDLLLPWLRVTDNVLLGARLRGERPNRSLALALLDQVGLADKADARPAELSGGQRQRAALARTLMEDHPVVLMDEPFSALDTVTRSRLQDLAAELLRGRTVLLVTHDPLEALRLGHRLYVMEGRPAQLDRVLEPSGRPPRDPSDPGLLGLQGELLGHLRDAADAA